MRAVLHLLTMLCLLWCALGISEPAMAQDHSAVQIYSVDGGAANEPVDTDTDSPERGHHQHCPIAPEIRFFAATAPIAFVVLRPLAQSYRALSSLTGSPPLQPPAA